MDGVIYWVRYGRGWKLMEGEHLRVQGKLHRRLREVTNRTRRPSPMSVKDYKIGSVVEAAGSSLEPSEEIQVHYGRARRRNK